jgi:hypothetical protein
MTDTVQDVQALAHQSLMRNLELSIRNCTKALEQPNLAEGERASILRTNLTFAMMSAHATRRFLADIRAREQYATRVRELAGQVRARATSSPRPSVHWGRIALTAASLLMMASGGFHLPIPAT